MCGGNAEIVLSMLNLTLAGSNLQGYANLSPEVS